MEESFEIESECFFKLKYEIKGKHIIIKTKDNGTMCFDMKHAKRLTHEIMEICNLYMK